MNIQLRHTFVLLVLSAICAQTKAQTPVLTDSFKNKPIIPYTPSNYDSTQAYGIAEYVLYRRRSMDFFRKMTQIAEPSTISGLVTNATFHTNPAYNKKPHILNADINVPIALGGKKWGGKKWINTLHLVPQFKVRILSDDSTQVPPDESFPVRTPSYLPRITWYGAPAEQWESIIKDRYYLHPFVGISAYHHSNGQDGDEFDPLTGEINVYNGNFGQNLVFEFSVGNVLEWCVADPGSNEGFTEAEAEAGSSRTVRFSEREERDRMLAIKLAYEWHPYALSNEAFRQYELYGRHRILTQTTFSIIPSYRDLMYSKTARKGGAYVAVTPLEAKELFRIVVNAGAIVGPYYKGDLNGIRKSTIGDRINADLTAHWRITGAPHAGVFVQVGYYGSDPYNIYFQQSMFMIRGGISMAFFKYPRKGDFED